MLEDFEGDGAGQGHGSPSGGEPPRRRHRGRRVSTVSFPRDLYVGIPGHGKDKINTSYAYGGAPLLVKTVQGLVDVPIDHVAHIGFEGSSRGSRRRPNVRASVSRPTS